MDLYQENIMDHYHHPHHHGTLPNPTHVSDADNPTCGDRVHITAVVKDGIVTDIAFIGEGCAISQAATSMITDVVIGKTCDDVRAIDAQKVMELLGVTVGMGRMRCALLGISAIQKAIGNS